MLGCPIESGEEWKKILASANGNRRKALEMWRADENLGKSKDLNQEIDDETFINQRQGQPDPITEENKDEYSKLIRDIKLYLSKEYAKIKKKKLTNETKKKEELQKVIDEFSTLEGVESIIMFIKDAYDKSQKIKVRVKNILETRGEKTARQFIKELSAVNDYVSGYSILDEIEKAEIWNYFSDPVDPSIPDGELTPQQMISKALETRRLVSIAFVNEGIPLMAEFLLEFKSENSDKDILEKVTQLQGKIDDVQKDASLTNEEKTKRVEDLEKEIAKYQSFSLDKQSLIEILKTAQSDTGVLDYLISPLISSEDAAIALFAKAIKSHLETARLKDVELERLIAPVIDKYASTTSASMDNKAAFNEGLYETITYDYVDVKTGETRTMNYMAFVQKYNISAYEKSKYEFFKKLGPRPIPADLSNVTYEEEAAINLYNRKIGVWYANNKQAKPIEEINKIIAAKQKDLYNKVITKEEYDAWYEDRVYKNEQYGTISYRKELSEPANRYLNPKWVAMYDSKGNPKNAKGEYHKFLLDTYLQAQDLIPDSQKPGFRLPSIPKSDLERAMTNGVISTISENIKDATQFRAHDTQFGIADTSQLGVKFIPIHYIQYMSPEDVSLDLGKSVMMFSGMANRYNALNELNGEISLFKTIIGNPKRVLETNSQGKNILDVFANTLGYEEFIRQNGESYTKKHLDAFLDMVVYGEMQKAEELFGLSTTKITNTLSGYSALTSIALDPLKGIANNLQGNIQIIIEAMSGQFFSTSDLSAGKAFYLKSTPQMLADFGKRTPESLVGQLVQFYDGIQGEFVDQYGKKVTSTVATKLFSTNTLFFNMNFGEHELQVSTMLALMNATNVIDKKTGNTISLLQAHTQYGAYGVAENTDFTEKRRQDFQNRLHALNKRLHGVYNEFDKGTAQRYSLGRLAIMYRKHLVPGYKRRFKSLSMDQELGTFTEGFYITFWRLFAKDLLTFKWNMIDGWSTYTAFEKAQMKRAITEISIILTTTALVSILTSMGEDDDELKDNYAYNFALYEAIRMRSETASYISPKDAYRVVKSPSAMTSTLERAIKFSDQFFFTWDPDKLEFERKSGIWNKGDNKSWAYFLKLIGFSGYNLKPEEAVESFKGTLNK
jgi:hypothetical protein